MKRIGILAAFAALTGCGWYTNVPAQISVASVEPATVLVTIEGAKASFTNPTVTLKGQNGSIGATYTKADVVYKVGAESAGIANKSMYINLRVDPTYLKKYPAETSTTKEVEFTPGSGQAVLPIIDQDVIDAGKSKRSMTAIVTLTGGDDANFGTSLPIYVPIVFTGQ